jgi:hypothetical protein
MEIIFYMTMMLFASSFLYAYMNWRKNVNQKVQLAITTQSQIS